MRQRMPYLLKCPECGKTLRGWLLKGHIKKWHPLAVSIVPPSRDSGPIFPGTRSKKWPRPPPVEPDAIAVVMRVKAK